MVDRKVFFDMVRSAPFTGALNPGQVDGMNRILDEWIRSQIYDLRFLAYMLATTFHETAFTMQPIREMGSEDYLKAKPYYPWVGEGLVQVTWEANARKFGATAPGQLLSWPLCLKPLFDGMLRGMFTGKRLADYFNNMADDPIGARHIINGSDRANTIAHYHSLFLAALKAAQMPATVPTAPIPVPTHSDAAPVPKPPVALPVPYSEGPLAAILRLLITLLTTLFPRKV